MKRWMIVWIVFALFACGEQDEQQGSAEGELSTVDAAEAGAGAPEVEVPEISSLAADLQAARCLELMSADRFAEAFSVCLAALETSPEDEQIKAAVERAKAESSGAALADAEAAAGDAADTANEAAADAVETTTPSIPTN
ncbi:MAG: hypothetical protein JRH16_17915 [Deltaproteobacteria bacterium]|nr:hypothetical protein [Deltaproteobacteria bacterium]MBW2362417.1 hypothetical protein [Deltaproteobacteria bacterium]